MIEVFSNGIKFDYWTSVSITRTLGNIAAGFRLTLANRDSQGNRIRLFSGDLVEIDLDGIGALKGFIGPMSVSFDDGRSSLSYTGYEMTCDLVDCSSIRQLEWKNKTADRIVSDICDEFGLSFFNPNSVDCGEPISNFSVEPGSKAVDAIAKLCKMRGILPCSNGVGKVYVVKPSAAARGPRLAQGVNIYSASANYDSQALYSDYYVYGTGKAKKKIVAHVHDPNVRNRPLVIVDPDAIDKASVDARAAWEMSTRKAKSLTYSVSVKGWKRDETHLWEPGIVCTLDAPALYVEDPVDMIVSAVQYDFSYSGENATLTLVPVDCFEPEPETKKPAAARAPKKKASNVWNQIKQAVKQ